MPTWSDDTQLARERQRQEQIGDIASRAVADRTGTGSVFNSPSTARPPRPVGLTLLKQTHGFKATWITPEVVDIQRFDLQISDNAAFYGTATGTHGDDAYSETHVVTGASAYIPSLYAGITYYARIRSISTAGRVSEWSFVASSDVTSTIITEDLVAGDVIEFLGGTHSDDIEFNNVSDNDDTDNISVTGIDASTYLIISATVTFNFASVWGVVDGEDNSLTIQMRDGGSVKDTVQLDFKSTVPTHISTWNEASTGPDDTQATVITFTFAPYLPAATSADIDLLFTTLTESNGNASLYILIDQVVFDVMVVKR